MDFYVKIYFSPYFPFLFCLKHDLIRCVDFPVSQLLTQKVMTSQIMSHVEYLIQTYYILVLIFVSKLMKNLAIMAGFNTI